MEYITIAIGSFILGGLVFAYFLTWRLSKGHLPNGIKKYVEFKKG